MFQTPGLDDRFNVSWSQQVTISSTEAIVIQRLVWCLFWELLPIQREWTVDCNGAAPLGLRRTWPNSWTYLQTCAPALATPDLHCTRDAYFLATWQLCTSLQPGLSFFEQTQNCNNQFVISSWTESLGSAANVKGNKQFDGQHTRALVQKERVMAVVTVTHSTCMYV
jgi:hypothetical protein